MKAMLQKALGERGSSDANCEKINGVPPDGKRVAQTTCAQIGRGLLHEHAAAMYLPLWSSGQTPDPR
jgi:hypothetical protein